MTAVLSVHLVREHIRRATPSGRRGEPQPSTVLLGRIFHEVAADLVGEDPGKNVFWFLESLDFDRDVWCSHLVPYVYDRLVGPRLAREQARLQEASREALHFWEAVQALCGWLIGLAWTATNPEGRKKAFAWEDLRKAMRAEVPLEAEFHEPGWSEPVLLTGVADSLLNVPPTGAWCIQEYKIGRASPEADLSQVCLYHLILARALPARKAARRRTLHRTLALLSFQPELKERVFNQDEIASAQGKLLSLIGRLAGVSGGTTRAVRAAPARSRDPMRALGLKLVRVFDEYRRPVEMAGEPIEGPAFFRFPINLGRGIKLEQIQRLSREVQVRLGLQKPPFIGVDRGKVVVDIERADRQIIRLDQVKHQLPHGDLLTGSPLVPIGIDIEGRFSTADLSNPLNAHLLVAGTTGSGKTEWLRTAIQGLIHCNTPQTLRLILIDPKRTAFSEFRDSPFLLTHEALVYPDAQPVLAVLKDLVTEMERRYQRFEEAGVDDLSGYVRTKGPLIPRIVCICDEYYALVTGDLARRKEIEFRISLLGAKARAAGIHLILATQQPSREVIRGVLDSNIPGRVGLMMVKGEESKMLLGQRGAENLLGKGDLLFRDVGEPVRLQAPLV